MSSYLSSLLSAFGGRGGNGGGDADGDSDFEDATGSEENQQLNKDPAAVAGGKAAGSKAGAAAGKSQDPSVHWLSVQTTETDAKVVVEKAAGDHLAKLGAETALNLVSIFGGARQGKSFLMNMLAGAGDDRLFKISNSKDPCTQGVDISRKVLSWSQFHRLDDLGKNERRSLAKSSSEPRPHVAFVDVEGQGDRDITYDANLTCPIVLASKAVIFNWKDSLQKDKLLNMLGIVARAAANVAPDEEAEADVHEPMFGHLHICFRDWTYEGDRDSVYQTLFTREQSNAPDAMLRNQVRGAVTAAFESITVWLLPPPVEQVAALRKELVASDLSAEFKAQVTKLRHALAVQLKAPKHFAGTGKVLTGPKIASLVPQVVATLNSGARVLPKSAYAALIESEVARVQASYLRRLQRALHEAKRAAEGAPLATPALHARIQGEVHALQRDFDRWLRTLGDDAAALAAAGAFGEHCAKGAEEVVAFNRAHVLPEHVAAAGREAKKAFDARFSLAGLEPRFPMLPERLVGEHTAARAAAEAGVRAVVAGEPDAEALLGQDALPALRTHAELVLTKVAAANQGKLAGVAASERGAYEAARAGFEADFFARLQALKAGGRAVSEEEYVAAFDAALAAARRALAEGVKGELTPAARKEELEAFMVAAAEACKREQGILYQLDCTEKLVVASLAASAALVGAVAGCVAFEAPTEAALQADFQRKRQVATTALETQLDTLAATDACKTACRQTWQGVGEAAWTVVKAVRAGRAEVVAAAEEEARAQAARQQQEAAAAAAATAADRAAAEEWAKAAAQLAAAEARVRELEAAVGRLDGEKREWEAERAEVERILAETQQVVEDRMAAAATAAAIAAAAPDSASKKRKAEEEEEEEEGEDQAPARPAAKSRRKGGKAAAAAAAAAEEEEEEEASGMEVDAPVVKEEEEEQEETQAPASAKGKKKAAAAAPKGRAAKGSKGAAAGAAAAASAAASPGQGTKLAKAREEERKRIEESMAKRITRAGRGK